MRFTYPHNSPQLWTAVAVTFVISMGLFFVMSNAPAKVRRWIVGLFTFVSGSYYVLTFLWPTPINRAPGDLPRDMVEGVSFWLADFQTKVADISNVLTAFLLGLGVFSVVTIHSTRLIKKQKDWGFSVVLLVSMVAMAAFGYWDFVMRQNPVAGAKLEDPANWQLAQFGFDVLFNGLLQQMDAAMFSIIAFYILSAAYRAFRIRSIESTVLMGSALIMMLSLMGSVDVVWSHGIKAITHDNPGSFWNNLQLTQISGWFRNVFQVPSLRALDFGIGLGALAMGLRLWLGLEKGGVN